MSVSYGRVFYNVDFTPLPVVLAVITCINNLYNINYRQDAQTLSLCHTLFSKVWYLKSFNTGNVQQIFMNDSCVGISSKQGTRKSWLGVSLGGQFLFQLETLRCIDWLRLLFSCPLAMLIHYFGPVAAKMYWAHFSQFNRALSPYRWQHWSYSILICEKNH